MLKYIVTVTEDLLIPATLIPLLYAFCGMAWNRRGRILLRAGIGIGLAASAAMAVVKNTTKLIYTNQWNQWIFLATIAVTALFVIFSAIFGREKQPRSSAGGVLTCAPAAVLSALLIFYEVPDVMAYPFLFDTAGNGVISVDYLVRLIGWTLALILLFVFMRYLYRSALALRRIPLLLTVLNLGAVANAVRCFGQAFARG